MPQHGQRGMLITLEGGEGSGKSTQAEALCRLLKGEGYRVTVTCEPSGTDLGKAVWALFKHEREPPGLPAGRQGLPAVTPLAELFLFEAARAQHVAQVIRPALERGEIVLCDRFTDSTLAYQGYGRGLAREEVLAANRIATGGLVPDLTLLPDVPPDMGRARKEGERTEDRIGQESLDFHSRVRRGFLELAAQEPGRIVVVDGDQPSVEVTRAAWSHVRALLA